MRSYATSPFPDGGIDPWGLQPPWRGKPGVATHGLCLTLGIELLVASTPKSFTSTRRSGRRSRPFGEA